MTKEKLWQWYGLHGDFNAGAYNGEEGTFLLTATVSVHSAPNHPNHWPSYGCRSEKISLINYTSLF